MKKGNILVIEYSANSGHAHYVSELVNELKKLGEKIFVLSGKGETELKKMVNVEYNTTSIEENILKNDIKLVHFFQSSFRKIFPFLIKNIIKKKVKTVYTVHNYSLHEKNSIKGFIFNLIQNKLILRIVDHVIIHNEYTRSKLDKKIKKNKITVIPHGDYGFIDNHKYSRTYARKKLKIKKNEFMVLSFGTIREYKGINYLVDATREMKNTKLVIAGKSWKEMKNYLLNLKKEKFIQIYDKFIPTKDIELYFKAADVTAYPYKRITTSGALMIAMMLKTPIVATRVGSIEETIGGVSCLVKPKNSKSLKKALEYLQEHPTYRKKIANKAYQKAKKEYSWKNSAKKTKIIYNSLI